MILLQIAAQLLLSDEALFTVIQLFLISHVLLIDDAEARVTGGWPARLLPVKLVQVVLHLSGCQLESVRILLPHPILELIPLQVTLYVL